MEFLFLFIMFAIFFFVGNVISEKFKNKEGEPAGDTNDFQEYIGHKCPPHNWGWDKKKGMVCKTCKHVADTEWKKKKGCS